MGGGPKIVHLHKDLFKASDNKTEHFLPYLEDFLDFIVVVVVFGGGGGLKPRTYQL